MQRKTFLEMSLAGLAGMRLAAMPGSVVSAYTVRPRALQPSSVLAQHHPFVLPPLGYAASAVEPAVDAPTMLIHHDKHHAAYVAALNDALKPHPTLHRMTLRELLAGLASLPEGAREAVRNNAGGHANHAFFWTLLAPGGAKAPAGALATAIARDFASQAALTAAIKEGGLAQFGSGWVWLVRNAAGRLTVQHTPNQNTPISDDLTPVIAIDVWEHAYYLKYQNRRADYLDAVLGALNWDTASAAYGGQH